jgi:2-phosphoglycolate phosphatase
MIKYVLFDFDGTLVDTAEDIVNSLLTVLKKNNLHLPAREAVRASIGDGFRGLLKSIPELNKSETSLTKMQADFFNHYNKNLTNNPKLYPGIEGFLNNWEHKIGILSNKTQKHIPPLLEQLNIHNYPWECIIGGDTYEHAKPHPLPMHRALEIANMEPRETLLVGDGVPDVQVAKATGVHYVAVDFGYCTKETLRNAGAKNFISHHEELLDHIHSINASC